MLTPKEMLDYVRRMETEINSRFVFAQKGLRPKAAEPDFSRLGPLGVLQNLQHVLWYCEKLRDALTNARAQDWAALSPKVHIWFSVAYGLAAAENMLPMDEQLEGLLVPANPIVMQQAA